MGAVPAVGEESLSGFLSGATGFLAIAFDTTLVALLLSLILMFLLHMVQRDQESLVLDCQQYCADRLLGRFYELAAEPAAGAAEANAAAFAADQPWA
jgi:hypothetical protein